MADQKVDRDLPAELQVHLSPQHGFWMKFHDKSMKNAIFDPNLRCCISTNILWNFMKPRLRAFWGQRVPIMLPEISATSSDRNFSNTFKNKKCFLREINFILKVLPKFRSSEVVAEIFGNMMGTLRPQKARRRGFMKFHNIFLEIQHHKFRSKMA